MASLRVDEVGELCQNDPLITAVGQYEWAVSVKRNRKTIMTDMRRLGLLLLSFRSFTEQASSGEEMLKRGKRLAFGYLLKMAGKALKTKYLQDCHDTEAQEVDNWLTFLKFNWTYLFNRAQLKVVSRRMSSVTTLKARNQDYQVIHNYACDTCNTQA